MSNAGGWNVRWDDFNENVVNRLATAKRGALPVLIEQGKGIVREIMNLTPPGSTKRDGLLKQSQRAGQQVIYDDLLGGGSRNKKQRSGGIFSPMDRGIIEEAAMVHGSEIARLWITKDGTPYGVEKDMFFPHPSEADIREHHKRYYRNGRFTRAGGATKDIGRWRFIDKFVLPKEDFTAYLKEQYAKVGYLMSGWRVAARKLGLNIPDWVANADGPSSGEIQITEDRLRIVASNEVSFASTRIPDRRIQKAIDRQSGKMQRAFEDYVAKLAR